MEFFWESFDDACSALSTTIDANIDVRRPTPAAFVEARDGMRHLMRRVVSTLRQYKRYLERERRDTLRTIRQYRQRSQIVAGYRQRIEEAHRHAYNLQEHMLECFHAMRSEGYSL
jgi:exonuclease VII large subunit